MLSRKHFFGIDIYQGIPFCVLEEISGRSCSLIQEFKEISQESYFELLNEVLQNSYEYPDTFEGWCKFINPTLSSKKWTPKSTEEAKNILMRYIEGEELPENFEVGFQTPDKLQNVNVIILYLRCYQRNFQIEWKTTKEELRDIYILHYQSSTEKIFGHIERCFSEYREPIIGFLATLGVPLFERKFVEKSDIESFPKHLSTPPKDVFCEYVKIKYLNTTNKQEPLNNTTTVLLTGLKYNIDISFSADPYIEYQKIENEEIQNYQPFDPWMNYWWQINKNIFDLTKHYNPWFPKSFYETNQIGMKILKNYGYLSVDKDKVHDKLKEIFNQDYAFCGHYPGIKNKESPILKYSIEEYCSEDLLSIIIQRPNHPRQVFGITKEDVFLYFENTKNFFMPFEETSSFIFQESLLNQIDSMLGENLGEKIVHIKSLIDTGVKKIVDFSTLYFEADDEKRNKIDEMLKILKDIIMFMRGWTGEGELPIEEAITPEENFAIIEDKFYESYYRLQDICNENPENDIRNLPLFCYRDGQYLIPNVSSEGVTIGDKLRIITEGEESSNNSCIRISSNWLAASLIRITEQLNLKPPFSIQKLRYIL